MSRLAIVRRKAPKLHGLGQLPAADDSGRLILPPWIYPPAEWELIDRLGYVAIGAIGAGDTIIISYQVPSGRNGVIRKVGNNFVGGGWVEGSGSIIWRILVDGTAPPAATDYDTILGSLGSPANPVESAGFRIYENQLLTVVVSNISVLVAAQLAGARLVGWTYPREYEEAGIWV